MKKAMVRSIAGTLFAIAFSWPAQAQEKTIRVGEINSFKAQAGVLDHYRKGLELGLEEVNGSGGVMGRKIEFIYRDDGANPGDAVRVAEELVSREKVDLLTGGFLSNVGLALADFAKQRKVFFLATETLTDKIVWQNGNRYTFRLRASTYMQSAMLAPEAAKLGKKCWAMVYPNYEYGQSAAATFKEQLKMLQPDVEFVGEQTPPLGRLDAGAVVQALSDSRPDGIFCALFGSDLARFVREGNIRGLFKGKEVVAPLAGEPEYLDSLKGEAPEGWIVTGYPWYGIDTQDHKAFFIAYHKKYNDYPRLASVVRYTSIKALAAGLKKSNSTDTEKMISAFRGLKFESPFGKVMFRALDHQATFGIYVGRIAVSGGKGEMRGYTYRDGAQFLPANTEVRKLRAAD